MRDVLDFLTFSEALGSSHNIHGRDLNSAFCQIRSNNKTPYPVQGKWGFISFIQGLRVSRLLDLEAGFGSKSDTPTRAKNLKRIILKSAENVKEFK